MKIAKCMCCGTKPTVTIAVIKGLPDITIACDEPLCPQARGITVAYKLAKLDGKRWSSRFNKTVREAVIKLWNTMNNRKGYK